MVLEEGVELWAGVEPTQVIDSAERMMRRIAGFIVQKHVQVIRHKSDEAPGRPMP
jgi:hypothetical protein